jgi:hypothetical protein
MLAASSMALFAFPYSPDYFDSVSAFIYLGSWAAKLTNSGDIEWQKMYTYQDKIYEGSFVTRPTQDGGFIAADYTELISVNLNRTGGGNDHSSNPQISPNGRYVVFASKASDLVPNDTNNASDIFVRDRVLGLTLLISANYRTGQPANGPSSWPVMSLDGSTVVFQSYASDLVPGYVPDGYKLISGFQLPGDLASELALGEVAGLVGRLEAGNHFFDVKSPAGNVIQGVYYQGKDHIILISKSYFPGGTLDDWQAIYEDSLPKPCDCDCPGLARGRRGLRARQPRSGTSHHAARRWRRRRLLYHRSQ